MSISRDQIDDSTIEPQSINPAVAMLREYVKLTKLRMGVFSALIAVLGYYLAITGPVHLLPVAHTFFGTWIVCAGAFTLNMYLERELDGRMRRTQNRPLPAGRISPLPALVFGMVLSATGLLYLAFTTNLLAASVAAMALGSYVAVYTPMKQISSLNTLVGAFPGAMPPIIGWAVARGDINFGAATLFGILFLWQLPHFLAIAWMYKEDYAAAGMPMITTFNDNGRFTARQMIIYSAAFVLMTLMPCDAGLAGDGYFWTALVTGVLFFGLCVRWAIIRDRKSAVVVFLTTLIHLPLLFTVMVLDKV